MSDDPITPPGGCRRCWSRGRNPKWDAKTAERLERQGKPVQDEPEFVWFNHLQHPDPCDCHCHSGVPLNPFPVAKKKAKT